MCDFPSWIEEDDGTVLFLTDKDLEERNIPPVDGVGHDAIRKVFPGIKGVDKEGFSCPPEIAKAVNAGKMQKMMRVGGYEEIHLDEEGRFHCDSGPAVVFPDGRKKWYQNGLLHNDNGPAVVCPDGTKAWYQNGKLHALVYLDGTKRWFQHGQLHNDNGPAVVFPDGTKLWYRNGLLHNDNGPAIVWPNGRKSWFQNGKEVPPPNEQKENENVGLSKLDRRR